MATVDQPFRNQSDWNAQQLDIVRMDKLLQILDVLGIRIVTRDSSVLEQYYAVMEQLYFNFRALIFAKEREKLELMISKARTNLDIWIRKNPNPIQGQFPTQLARDLRDIHKELMFLRQAVGLSFRTTEKMSQAEKMHKGIVGR